MVVFGTPPKRTRVVPHTSRSGRSVAARSVAAEFLVFFRAPTIDCERVLARERVIWHGRVTSLKHAVSLKRVIAYAVLSHMLCYRPLF